MATNCQPNGNQMETQYRLGKDSIVQDYVDVASRIKNYSRSLCSDYEIDVDKYIKANMIQIGRIIEAYSFEMKGYEEVLFNILMFNDIAKNYGEAKIEVINNLEEKEYQKIFDKIQIASVKINSNEIIDVRAFVSSYISKCVNKHLLEKGELNSDDRIEYQW